MPEALKNYFSKKLVDQIAQMIKGVHPKFDSKEFNRTALRDFKSLNLLQRGQKIASALRQYLPKDFKKAAKIILLSLGPKLGQPYNNGMSPFLYFPFAQYTATYGLASFEAAMQLQHELTQRSTAEFSIREFLKQDPERTLKRLKLWAKDPSVHVRRLVSEGTRPRLPWACRLPQFQKDPQPVLDLLELLKDDPEIYVQRSVANNLNDISKDNPKLFYQTLKRWQKNASPQRMAIIQHALRSAIKRTEPEALKFLGYHREPRISLQKVKVYPKLAKIGNSLEIAVLISNQQTYEQSLLVDLRIHYIKFHKRRSAKVFKLKAFRLGAGEQKLLTKKLTLKNLSTRKHYPGKHLVELIINGHTKSLGAFELTE